MLLLQMIGGTDESSDQSVLIVLVWCGTLAGGIWRCVGRGDSSLHVRVPLVSLILQVIISVTHLIGRSATCK